MDFIKLLEAVSKVGAPIFIVVWYFYKVEPRNQDSQNKLRDAIENLASSITLILGAQTDMKEKLSDLENTIDQKKEWDINTYCDQINNILKLTIYKFRDYLYDKVDRNSLYENKVIISKEILIDGRENFQTAIDGINSVKFNSTFDRELTNAVKKMTTKAIADIISVFDVNSSEYDKEELKRQIKNLAKTIETNLESEILLLKDKWG